MNTDVSVTVKNDDELSQPNSICMNTLTQCSRTSLEFRMISRTTTATDEYESFIPTYLTQSSSDHDMSYQSTNICMHYCDQQHQSKRKSVKFADESHTNNDNVKYRPSSSKLRLNMTSQSSTSFNKVTSDYNPHCLSSEYQMNHSFKSQKQHNMYDNSVNIDVSTLQQCPNMVHGKCHCKNTLSQMKEAQNVWSGCYRINISNSEYLYNNRDIDIAYFDGLYGKLCEFFQLKVGSDRIPSKQQISEAILFFGGFMINGKNKDLMIDRCNFVRFWKWFSGTCAIIKDIYFLWDARHPFKLELFVNRQKCENILKRTPKGTFLLRLSQSQPNGLVISYSQPCFNRVSNIKHLLLIRKSEHDYIIKTNKNSKKSSSLNSLIRTFVKLKFIYTPIYLYKKEHIF